MKSAAAFWLLSASALLAISVVAGCGLANETHSVIWTALLDRMPDQTCARDSIASAPDISQADVNARPAGYVFGAHLKDGSVSGPDIFIVMTREGHDPVQFRMTYGDYQRGREEREIAAHAIISKLSAGCGIPELAQRAKERHDSEWMPYMFNI